MIRWTRPRASTCSVVIGLLATAVLALGGCGQDETASPGGGTVDAGYTEDGETGTDEQRDTQVDFPDIDPSTGPASVETTAPSNAQVGSPIDVGCKLLNEDGEEITSLDVDFELVLAPSDKFTRNSSDEWVPVAPGEAEVACAARSFNLVDQSPETFQIEPGPPHTVRTALDKNKVQAGTPVNATCSVFDEYGNPVPNTDPDVEVNVSGAGINVDGREVTIETADTYQVTCTLSGAPDERSATLEVNPGLPANIAMDPVPSKQVYGLGEVVRFAAIVTDQYGNEVRDAEVDYSVTPSATPFGTARWEFNKEGTFEITGTVQGQTKDGQDLSDSVTIIVNEDGPEIECQDPADGTIVQRKTTGKITFNGSVSDTHDISKVTVRGSTVTVNQNGSFSTDVGVRFGINFLDVTATDQYGAENSKTCAFLVSENFHDQSNFMTGAVALELRQAALDDGSYSQALDSIADIFYQVLNSSQLLIELDKALINANPLVKDKCFVEVLGVCAVRGDIYYIRDPEGGKPGSGIETGKNTLSLDWNDSPQGMSISTVLAANSNDDVRLRLKFETDTCGNFRGWLVVSKIETSLDAEIQLKNGNLQASLVPNSTTVNSGTVDPDFKGSVCTDLADLLKGILQDTYQNAVEDALKNQLKDTVPSLLDSLFSSLDVSSLSDTFSIQQFDGQGTVDINFNVKFTSLGIDTARALLGLGTKFTPGKTRVGLPSKGVPLPNGDVFHDPNVTNNDTGASMYIGVINHILHALWRGGMFEGKLGKQLFGSSAPQGTKADLSVNLPPVARLEGASQVDLMMGAVTLELTYPGIFDKPVIFDVGLVAETGVQLQGSNSLQFQNITITEFYFTPRNISLDSDSRSVLESFLKGLFQKVVDRSLNKGLPAIPIPSFTIDQSLAKFGLPQGAKIGITSPTLGAVTNHFTLKGDFGKK